MAEESCSGGTTANTTAEDGGIRGTNTEDEIVDIGDSEGTQVNHTNLILVYSRILISDHPKAS